ncbi:MAG: TonB-dependent receptor [Candidatus Sericytochromatia bacterium]
MYKSKILKSFILSTVLLNFSLYSFAEENKEVDNIEKLSLEELLDMKITTVSKYEQKITEAPATILVITKEQIKSRGYKDLKDIFNDLPGFDFSGNVTGEIRSMAIPRGLTGDNKILVLQDGQKVNSPTGERLLLGNNIPIFNAKRIEVIYGPASAVYGADAFGAIINIITNSGADINGVELNANYGNLNTYLPSITIGKKFEDLDLMLSGRFLNSDGQKFAEYYKELAPILKYKNYGFNYQQPINNFDFYGKLKYKGFSLMFNLNNATEPNGESEIANNYMYVKENVWGQKINRIIAEYYASLFDNKLDSVSTISNYIYEVTPDTNFNLAYERDKEEIPTKAKAEYKYAYSSTLKVEEQLNYYPFDFLTLTGGGSFENLLSFAKTQNLKNGKFDTTNLVDDMSAFIDPKNGKAFGTIDSKAFGLRPYQNYAGFLQAEIKPFTPLRLTVGGRYDYNTIYAGTFNPRLGVVFKALDNLSLKLNYGTAYIQPSNYYRWENWANPFAMHIPNLDLKPEKVGSINFNANYQISNNINLDFDLFRNDVVDIIRPVPIDQNSVFNPFLIVEKDKSYAETNKNSGKQYTQGAEVKLNYAFGHTKLFDMIDFKTSGFLNYSYLMGEDLAINANEKNTEIAKISNHKVGFGLDLGIWKLNLAPRVRWVSPISTLPFNSEFKGNKFEGYLLVNLNSRLDILDNLSAYFTVENLLDSSYYSAAPFGESVWILPRAPQAKRTFLFGLDYKFGM